MSDEGYVDKDALCRWEGHQWRGGGYCIACGERLRCICGVFVTEGGLEKHLDRCRVLEATLRSEGMKEWPDVR